MPDAATVPPLDNNKIRAIAARLASDHDGEVIAAARALVRAAARSGLKVQELFTVQAAMPSRQPDKVWPTTGTSAAAAAFQAAMRRARQAETKRSPLTFETLVHRLRTEHIDEMSWDDAMFVSALYIKGGQHNGDDMGRLFALGRRFGIIS